MFHKAKNNNRIIISFLISQSVLPSLWLFSSSTICQIVFFFLLFFRRYSFSLSSWWCCTAWNEIEFFLSFFFSSSSSSDVFFPLHISGWRIAIGSIDCARTITVACRPGVLLSLSLFYQLSSSLIEFFKLVAYGPFRFVFLFRFFRHDVPTAWFHLFATHKKQGR